MLKKLRTVVNYVRFIKNFNFIVSFILSLFFTEWFRNKKDAQRVQ